MTKASAKQSSASAVEPPISAVIPEAAVGASGKKKTPAKKKMGGNKTKKTPVSLKKKSKAKKKSAGKGRKMKSLSAVKTPEAMKKKARVTPMKRKTPSRAKSTRPAKKAKN